MTSVYISAPAVEAIAKNFALNDFKTKHHEEVADVFEYLNGLPKKETFDFVITDPPSFAPNQKAVESARLAYIKTFSESIKRVTPGGLFAPSSCSAHISASMFEEIVKEAYSKARRRGTILAFNGQPIDHPTPLAMPELRYLKFALIHTV